MGERKEEGWNAPVPCDNNIQVVQRTITSLYSYMTKSQSSWMIALHMIQEDLYNIVLVSMPVCKG